MSNMAPGSPRWRLVRKSNDFIQTYRWSLSTLEQKVLLYLITKIDWDSDAFQTIELNISEFCRVCGIRSNGKTYADVKAALGHLVIAPICGPDGDCFVPLPDGETRVRLQFIIEPTVNARTGRLSVTISPTMRRFLLGLNAHYTQYELQYILCMQSRYAIRLYEYIKSRHYNDYDLDNTSFSWTLPLAELRTVMGVAADSYPAYPTLKQRVLTPAVHEINCWSDKTLSVTERKDGRRVAWLELHIGTKNSADLDAVRLAIAERLGPAE